MIHELQVPPMISSLSILNHLEIDSDHDVLAYGINLILLNAGMNDGIPATIFIF
jgi:hypothetical protein